MFIVSPFYVHHSLSFLDLFVSCGVGIFRCIFRFSISFHFTITRYYRYLVQVLRASIFILKYNFLLCDIYITFVTLVVMLVFLQSCIYSIFWWFFACHIVFLSFYEALVPRTIFGLFLHVDLGNVLIPQLLASCILWMFRCGY